MFARTESNASRIRNACGPPSWSTIATRASRIFPPNALPRTMSCTSGIIIDASMSAGDRKNLRISRSTIAIIRFISQSWFLSPELRVLSPELRIRSRSFRELINPLDSLLVSRGHPGPRGRGLATRNSGHGTRDPSRLQPRSLRHREGVGLLQFVAQLPPRIVDEYIVQRGVLHRKRFHWNPRRDGHL